MVARALRDAGFEVDLHQGLFPTPEQIEEAAMQEDADAVGLSCHLGAHMTLFPKVVNELRARGADDVVVVAGGVVPADDVPSFKEAGIDPRDIIRRARPCRGGGRRRPVPKDHQRIAADIRVAVRDAPYVEADWIFRHGRGRHTGSARPGWAARGGAHVAAGDRADLVGLRDGARTAVATWPAGAHARGRPSGVWIVPW